MSGVTPPIGRPRGLGTLLGRCRHPDHRRARTVSVGFDPKALSRELSTERGGDYIFIAAESGTPDELFVLGVFFPLMQELEFAHHPRAKIPEPVVRGVAKRPTTMFVSMTTPGSCALTAAWLLAWPSAPPRSRRRSDPWKAGRGRLPWRLPTIGEAIPAPQNPTSRTCNAYCSAETPLRRGLGLQCRHVLRPAVGSSGS